MADIKAKLLIPKVQHIDQKYWFVNPGILCNMLYEKASEMISSLNLNQFDLSFILFLAVKYLVCYLELFSLDQTPLMVDCIDRHLHFLITLTEGQPKSGFFIHYNYFRHTQNIFQKFVQLKPFEHCERQMYLSQLENICKMLITRSQLWIKNNDILSAYMFRYGYSPKTTAVLYCSYLIPNEVRYVNPLNNISQRLLDKIEMKCFCKIKLSLKDIPCPFVSDYVLLEILFDPYRGNFLGFLDMLGYLVRSLNSKLFFLKCLRTVILEESYIYNFLTDVPFKKLIRLGKIVSSNGKLESFLGEFSISKRLFSLIELIMEEQDMERSSTFDEYDNSDSIMVDDNTNICSWRKEISDEEKNGDLKNINSVIRSAKTLKFFTRLYKMKKANLNGRPVRRISSKDSLDSYTKSNFKVTSSVNNNANNHATSVMVEDIQNSPKVMFSRNCYAEILICDLVSDADHMWIDPRNRHNSITVKIDYIEPDMFVQQTNVCNANNPDIIPQSVMDVSIETHNFGEIEDTPKSVFIETETTSDRLFDSFLRKQFCYYTPLALSNHKLRVMMRCDTEELPQDLLSPFVQKRVTIQDRLHKNYGLKSGSKSKYKYFNSPYPNKFRLLYDKKNQDKAHKKIPKLMITENKLDNEVDDFDDPKILKSQNANVLTGIQSKLYKKDSYKTSKRTKSNNTDNSSKSFMLPHEVNSQRDQKKHKTWWLSDEANMLLHRVESDNIYGESYLSHGKSDSDSHIERADRHPMSASANLLKDALNYYTLVKGNVDMQRYMKRFGPETIKNFIDGKRFDNSWATLLKDQVDFDDVVDKTNFMKCNPNLLIQNMDKKLEDEFNSIIGQSSPKVKEIYMLLNLITGKTISMKQYKKILNGSGIDIPFFEKVNHSTGFIPVCLGYLTTMSKKDPGNSLSFCLCQLSYDLIVLNIQKSQAIHHVFKIHLDNFKNIVETCHPKIRRVISILNIMKRLIKVQNENGPDDPSFMVDLVDDLHGIHELIFLRPCCVFQNLKHAGLKILYHSIKLENRVDLIEPLMRLPGDRRLKKVEQVCHSLISLKFNRREVLDIDEFMLEIFYNFKSGNHFGTIDMLHGILNQAHKNVSLPGHRSLICFPTGELWVFNDLDWLKLSTTHFQTNERTINDIISMDDH